MDAQEHHEAPATPVVPMLMFSTANTPSSAYKTCPPSTSYLANKTLTYTNQTSSYKTDVHQEHYHAIH